MSEQKMPALPDADDFGCGDLYWNQDSVERIQREAYEAGRQQGREETLAGKYHTPLALTDPVQKRCYDNGWEAAMIDCKRAERERLEPLRVAVEAEIKEAAAYGRGEGSCIKAFEARIALREAARTLLEQTE